LPSTFHLLGHKDSESRAEWQIYLTISKAQPIFANQREAKYNFFLISTTFSYACSNIIEMMLFRRWALK